MQTSFSAKLSSMNGTHCQSMLYQRIHSIPSKNVWTTKQPHEAVEMSNKSVSLSEHITSMLKLHDGRLPGRRSPSMLAAYNCVPIIIDAIQIKKRKKEIEKKHMQLRYTFTIIQIYSDCHRLICVNILKDNTK